jgi:hypothetical protein
MVQILIFGGMLVCAMIPFFIVTRLMRAGEVGFTLTIIAVIGGTFAIFLYASGRPFGVDPVLAMGISMLACVPALLGSLSGALLGWLIRKRDDQTIG